MTVKYILYEIISKHDHFCTGTCDNGQFLICTVTISQWSNGAFQTVFRQALKYTKKYFVARHERS